jgi:hypothetical protein
MFRAEAFTGRLMPEGGLANVVSAAGKPAASSLNQTRGYYVGQTYPRAFPDGTHAQAQDLFGGKREPGEFTIASNFFGCVCIARNIGAPRRSANGPLKSPIQLTDLAGFA